jgi:hypothetical protein
MILITIPRQIVIGKVIRTRSRGSRMPFRKVAGIGRVFWSARRSLAGGTSVSRRAKPFSHQGHFYTSIGGKQRRLCAVEDGLDRAEEELRKLQSERFQTGRIAPDLTVADAAALFLRQVETDKGPTHKTNATPRCAGNARARERLPFLQPLGHDRGEKSLDGAVEQDIGRLFLFELQANFDAVALVCPDKVAGVIEREPFLVVGLDALDQFIVGDGEPGPFACGQEVVY